MDPWNTQDKKKQKKRRSRSRTRTKKTTRTPPRHRRKGARDKGKGRSGTPDEDDPTLAPTQIQASPEPARRQESPDATEAKSEAEPPIMTPPPKGPPNRKGTPTLESTIEHGPQVPSWKEALSKARPEDDWLAAGGLKGKASEQQRQAERQRWSRSISPSEQGRPGEAAQPGEELQGKRPNSVLVTMWKPKTAWRNT